MLQARKEDKLPVNRIGTGFGKPAFKDLPTEKIYSLDKFVGPDSRLIFSITRTPCDFLIKPVS